MNTNQFREIMKDIDSNAEGEAIDCWFLLSPGGKVVGTWEWLGDPKEWVAGNEVIIVNANDQPPVYVPVAAIVAIQVAPT